MNTFNNLKHLSKAANRNKYNDDCIVIMFMNIETVRINITTGECFIIRKNRLPFGLVLYEDKVINHLVSNINNFYHWCGNRTLSMSKSNAKKILNALSVPQDTSDYGRAMLALSYRCVSLDDAWWTKRINEDINWESVNLFDNKSKNILTPVSLVGIASSVFNRRLDNGCDLAVNGTFAKSWIRENDELYLLKADEYSGSDETVREVLASEILSCFNVPYVRYVLSEYEGLRVSKCKCYTSKEYSYIPWKDYKKYCYCNEINPFDIIMDKYWIEYNNMLAATYIIGNEDLHDGNWGFLLHNESFELVSLFYLFDFNYAMPFNYSTTNARNLYCLPEIIVINNETGMEIKESNLYKYEYEYTNKRLLEDILTERKDILSIGLVKSLDKIYGISDEDYKELLRRISLIGIK